MIYVNIILRYLVYCPPSLSVTVHHHCCTRHCECVLAVFASFECGLDLLVEQVAWSSICNAVVCLKNIQLLSTYPWFPMKSVSFRPPHVFQVYTSLIVSSCVRGHFLVSSALSWLNCCQYFLGALDLTVQLLAVLIQRVILQTAEFGVYSFESVDKSREAFSSVAPEKDNMASF